MFEDCYIQDVHKETSRRVFETLHNIIGLALMKIGFEAEHYHLC